MTAHADPEDRPGPPVAPDRLGRIGLATRTSCDLFRRDVTADPGAIRAAVLGSVADALDDAEAGRVPSGRLGPAARCTATLRRVVGNTPVRRAPAAVRRAVFGAVRQRLDEALGLE